MLEDYKNALKSGQRAYRACVARGQSPYLAVLDDILVNVNIVAQEPLGLVEIIRTGMLVSSASSLSLQEAPVRINKSRSKYLLIVLIEFVFIISVAF